MIVARAIKKKLKVFRVWADRYDYDQYDSFIIVGKDKESVLKQFETDKCGHLYRGPVNNPIFGRSEFCYFFEPNQGELHIEEIDITTPALILGSYNAG